MPRHRLASLVLAAVMVPAGCVDTAPCGDGGPLCLAADDVARVRVGFVPDALVFADVDGDGKRDLVTASSRAGTLTVLWSLPDARGRGTTWSIDQEVAGIVAADLDADGHLDLATALPRADAVAVVRGRGGREFAEPERYPAGAVPRALVAADLDAGGPLELITANLGDGTVSVLRLSAGGSFLADPPTVVGPGPRALAAGDLDHDGHLDLAVALADADAVQVLRGDGHGGLWPAALHRVGAAPRDLVVADLDADGHLDLATADSFTDTVSVLWGDGAGDLRGRATWPTAPLPRDLVVSTPADAPPVLGVLSAETSTVERLDPRTGDRLTGVLATAPRALADDGGTLISAGWAVSALYQGTGLIVTELWQEAATVNAFPVDLDGDGLDELLLQEFAAEPGTLSLRRSDGTSVVHTGVTHPEAVRAADITGDGQIDLVLHRDDALTVLVGQADGEFAPPVVTEIDDATDLALADADSDGVADVLVLVDTDDGGELQILHSDEAGALGLTRAFAFSPSPTFMRVIDGDGDATPDLLLGSLGLYFYSEDLREAPRPLAISDHYPSLPTIVDLDRDGRVDAVFCSPAGLYHAPDVFAATPPEPARIAVTKCWLVDVLDLDGDGDGELLTYNTIYVDGAPQLRLEPWQRDGDTWVARGAWSMPGGSIPVKAELDGDDLPELVIAGEERRAALDLDFGAVLLELEKLRRDARPKLHFGDIDGDGAADLVALGRGLAIARADGHGGFGPLKHLRSPVKPAPLDELPPEFTFRARDGDDPARLVWGVRSTLGPSTSLTTAALTLDGVDEPVVLAEVYGTRLRTFLVDLDGDAVRDLVALDLDQALFGYLLRGRPDGGFGEPEPLEFPDAGTAYELVFHDIDRDGHLDLTISALSYAMHVYFGGGDGSFRGGQLWSVRFHPSLSLGPPVLGDFDRDGQVELLTTNGGGKLMWHPRGDGPPRVLLKGVDAHASADLDRDGHPELIAVGPAPLTPERTRLHLGRGRSDGSFGFTESDVAAAEVREIHTADVDGDGELEILLVDEFGATIVRRAP